MSLPVRQGTPAFSAARIRLAGHVQGVGFRPFVFRLAQRFGLAGSVRNMLGEVEVVAVGAPATLAAFGRALIDEAPPLACPRLIAATPCEVPAATGFEILASDATAAARISVPPDYFACDACLAELHRPADRRYAYPFINCTQCGPRYTLIERLPYDRANTTMSGFALCAGCRAEYEDPLDRRFHAEPIACPDCGPQLEFSDDRGNDGDDDPLARAVTALLAGDILAVKGIGGYHLLCDARSDTAVRRLRERKGRPHKPLAVMFPRRGADSLDAVREEAHIAGPAAAMIADPSRPIVLAPRRSDGTLSERIAPGLAEIGVFLPYSPLHDLLLERCNRPLVATSGNISGEPVLTDHTEAAQRLRSIADALLHHDRPIVRPADDSVWRPIAGRSRPLRLGRGATPLELALPFRLEIPVLAVGGQQKNTVALAWDDRVVVSPHIGDMGTVRSFEVFAGVVDDLQSLYGVRAAELVCDAHPGYETQRWARRSGLPVTAIEHHLAHASALIGDVGETGAALVLTWDGVGLGGDGTLWGGETFYGRPGAWQRVASMRSFALPGGERAGREPWRSAAAMCWEAGLDYRPAIALAGLARQAWQRGINSPRSSAVGRLFDGFAALAMGITETSYEGQAPMLLEAACGGSAAPLELTMRHGTDGLLRVDWQALIGLATDAGQSVAERALAMHLSLARNIVDQARYFRQKHGIETVGLTGGVFQNRRLTEAALDGLVRDGFRVRLAERVPCNDGGLSFGQVMEFAARRAGADSKPAAAVPGPAC